MSRIINLKDEKGGIVYPITKMSAIIGSEEKANRDEVGYSLDLSLDDTTFLLTIVLKNAAGVALSTRTVDLPIESVVVSGRYDKTTKEVVLTLHGGSEIRFSVEDLVSGLQEELVSGQNIKTINGQSILGEGNINLDSGKIDVIKLNGTALPIVDKVVDIKLGDGLSVNASGAIEAAVKSVTESTDNGCLMVNGTKVTVYALPTSVVMLDANGNLNMNEHSIENVSELHTQDLYLGTNTTSGSIQTGDGDEIITWIKTNNTTTFTGTKYQFLTGVNFTAYNGDGIRVWDSSNNEVFKAYKSFDGTCFELGGFGALTSRVYGEEEERGLVELVIGGEVSIRRVRLNNNLLMNGYDIRSGDGEGIYMWGAYDSARVGFDSDGWAYFSGTTVMNIGVDGMNLIHAHADDSEFTIGSSQMGLNSITFADGTTQTTAAPVITFNNGILSITY